MPGPSGSTPKYGFPYPLSSDTTDVPRDILALANRMEALKVRAVTCTDLNALTLDGEYYATPSAPGNFTSQYALVRHLTSSDQTTAIQQLQTVTGTVVLAYRSKTGMVSGAGTGGAWGSWTIDGALPGIARGGGSGDYPTSGTGSTSSRNVWANLNVSSAVATFSTSFKCRAMVTYSAWMRIAPTNDTAQDIRVLPRIVVPGGTAYGYSSMSGVTTTPGLNASEFLMLGQDDAGAGVFTISATQTSSFTFDFPAGVSTATLQCYRSWPSGSTGSAKISYAKVQITPLQYIP